MRKFFKFMFILSLGAIVGIVGLFAGVGFVLSKITVGDILNWIGGGNEISAEDDATILNLILGVAQGFSGLSGGSIEDFEGAVGTSILSNALADLLKISPDTFVKGTFAQLPQNIMNAMTAGALFEMLGISPDFPLFRCEDFLKKPAISAFNGLGDEPLDGFVEVIYPCNCKALACGCAVDPDCDCGIENCDCNCGCDDFKCDCPAPSNILLQKLGKVAIGKIGTELDSVLNNTEFGELMTINETSPIILQSLRGATLNNLSERIDKLTIAEVFANTGSGVLALLPKTTPLNSVPTELQKAVNETNIYKLRAVGVFTMSFETDTYADVLRKTAMLNSSPDDILKAFARGESATDLVPVSQTFYGAADVDDVVDFDDLNANVNLIIVAAGATVTIEGKTFNRIANIRLLAGATLIIDGEIAFEDVTGYILIDTDAVGARITDSSNVDIAPTDLENWFISDAFENGTPHVGMGHWSGTYLSVA
jgi:hypothetical protein